MNKIKGNFGNKYNKITGRAGKVWQSRFYDEGIRSRQELLGKIEQVHNNPITAGLAAETPGEYEFSSYNYYNGKLNNVLNSPEHNSIQWDAIPEITNSMMFVPLRFVAEVFGYEVVWNAKERTLEI